MGVIPVQTNDVVFSVHAVILSVLTAYQCIIYEVCFYPNLFPRSVQNYFEQLQKGTQRVWFYTWIFIGVSTAFITCSSIAAAFAALTWLDVLYYCSYVKLAVTLIKYIPQAYMNYSRQSTVGYSIGGVLLDITGGLLSTLQMFLLAYNNGKWN